MNRETVEVDVVTKAHKATHNIRQPSWAAHCMALGMNLDEAEQEAKSLQSRPTIRVKTPAYDFKPMPLRTPAYDFKPTPLYTVIPNMDDLDLDWG